MAMESATKEVVVEDHSLGPLPEVILPSQFFGAAGARAFSSEQRLMLAVLTDAINVLRDYRIAPNPRRRGFFDEASSWVFATGVEGPMSFDHVCDALAINPESLRKRLSQMVSEQGGGSMLRLRLKQSGRAQQLTVNRGRSRRRAPQAS